MNKIKYLLLTSIIFFSLYNVPIHNVEAQESSDLTAVTTKLEGNSEDTIEYELNHIRYSKEEGQTITLEKDEIIDRDFFAAGENVEVYGTVNGDVYVAGGRVYIKGTIQGDLLVAGGQVTIDGSISDDVRVAGGDVDIRGNIGKNLTVAGGDVRIDSNATISGSLLAAAGNLEVEADIGKHATIGAGNVIISSNISGDLEGSAGELRVTPLATIGGNVRYWGSEEPTISEEATVAGEVTYKKTSDGLDDPEVKDKVEKSMSKIGTDVKKGLVGIKIAMTSIGFLSALLVGILLQKLIPQMFSRSMSVVEKKPWVCFGVGFAILVLTPVLSLILLVTIIGIPISFVLMFKYAVMIYLAKIFVAYWIGSYLFERFQGKNRKGWAIVLGLVIYYILTNIPVVGGLLSFVSLTVGLGAMIKAGIIVYNKARESKIV